MSTMTLDSIGRLLLLPRIPGIRHDLSSHVAAHGPLTIPTVEDPVWRTDTLRTIAESGLLGRGGAGFPSANKWSAFGMTSRRPMVVVNAMEGEPASAKDHALLSRAPHLVLDGAEVAAAAIDASDIVICIADQCGSVAASVEAAIDERKRSTRRPVKVTVERPPARYVSGEESALVSWLNTRKALPALRIDKSVPLHVGVRPALVHNTETLSQVALIARHGSDWFRRQGTPDAPGTTLVTVSGAVRHPGVLEVELGTSIRDILEMAAVDVELSGVLLGGYGGAWLDSSRLATPYAPGPLAVEGATHGVGIIVALPTTSCGIAETARIARYMAGESAGQCGPCVFGLSAVASDLEGLWVGRGDVGVVERIEARAAAIEGRGACRHPDGVVRLVRSALAVFANDARAHAGGRPCSGHRTSTVLTFPNGGMTGRRTA